MRKLDRSSVAAPPCLADYHHPAHTWDDVSPQDKAKMWAQLDQLQGRRCAYCEGPLDELGRHIEHFRRKSTHRALTFAWHNLYGSCDRLECCGHHKDRDRKKGGGAPYDPADLIGPCVDDPDHFLHFASNGSIRIRRGLGPTEQHRAQETLRVFNLDDARGHLRAMRKRAAEWYLNANLGILEDLLAFSAEDRRAYIASEVAATAGDPFSTVIRHLFEDLL